MKTARINNKIFLYAGAIQASQMNPISGIPFVFCINNKFLHQQTSK